MSTCQWPWALSKLAFELRLKHNRYGLAYHSDASTFAGFADCQQMLHSFAHMSWCQSGSCAAVESKATFHIQQASTLLSAALICWSAQLCFSLVQDRRQGHELQGNIGQSMSSSQEENIKENQALHSAACSSPPRTTALLFRRSGLLAIFSMSCR